MMNQTAKNNASGFSVIELIIAMTIALILLGLAGTLLGSALGTRKRESAKTDALTTAQAAINMISREISNSGFGLNDNGLVAADSNLKRIHFRSNIVNNDLLTDDPGEDVTYHLDEDNNTVVRFDRNAATQSSIVLNRISELELTYFDYLDDGSSAPNSVPSSNTGRVRITVTVILEPVQGQPADQTVTFTTDVTLRNSAHMRNQY